MKQKQFIIVILLLLANHLFAQKFDINKKLEIRTKLNHLFINAGVTIPVAKDIAGVYYYGYNTIVGASFNIYKQKLYIEPSFSYSGFRQKIDSDNSIIETTNIYSASLPIAFKILPNSTNNSLFLLMGLDYNYISNNISSQPVELFPTSDNNMQIKNIMKGNSISSHLGLRYSFISWLSVDACYYYMPAYLTLSNDIFDYYKSNGFIISKKNRLDFSQFRISLKINLLNF